MITKNEIVNTDIRLIIPNPKTHAKESIKWLIGEHGRENLRLMGCLVGDDFEPHLKDEVRRLKQMIKSKTEYLLMIEYKGKIVGQLELWTQQFDKVPTPSVSIFIGCPSMRNQSIGTAVLRAAHGILESAGFGVCHSRALLANLHSNNFFLKNGYKKAGSPYHDGLGLIWQNYAAKLNPLQPALARPKLSKNYSFIKSLSITSFIKNKRLYNAKY